METFYQLSRKFDLLYNENGSDISQYILYNKVKGREYSLNQMIFDVLMLFEKPITVKQAFDVFFSNQYNIETGSVEQFEVFVNSVIQKGILKTKNTKHYPSLLNENTHILFDEQTSVILHINKVSPERVGNRPFR